MCGDCGITSLSCCGEEICLWITGIAVLAGIIFLGIFFGVKVVPEVSKGTWQWYSFAAVLGAIIIIFTIILLLKDMCCPKQKFGDMTAIWANPNMMQPKVEVQINQASSTQNANQQPNQQPMQHQQQQTPVTMTQYHTQYVPVDNNGMHMGMNPAMMGQPVYMQGAPGGVPQQYYLAPTQPIMQVGQQQNGSGVVYLNQPKTSPRK